MESLTERLINNKISISTMESCTSGMLASSITDVDGSSEIFKGGFITYSNEAKIACGVNPEIIKENGVYSAATAIAMAKACRIPYSAKIGVGVTGSLGTVDPANHDSIPGVVYFAIDYEGDISDYRLEVPDCGSKHENKEYAVKCIRSVIMDVLDRKILR